MQVLKEVSKAHQASVEPFRTTGLLRLVRDLSHLVALFIHCWDGSDIRLGLQS